MKEGKSKTPRRSKDARITLSSVLDAAHGAELHEALSGVLADAGTVTLVVEEVERVDTAGVQVLAAFVLARRSAGRAVAWEQVSPELRRATDLLGMTGLMEFPQ